MSQQSITAICDNQPCKG